MSHFYVSFISFLRCSCPHFSPRLTDTILDTIADQSAIFTSHPVAARPALFICRNLLLPVKTGLKRYLTFEKKRLLKREGASLLSLHERETPFCFCTPPSHPPSSPQTNTETNPSRIWNIHQLSFMSQSNCLYNIF